VVHGQARLFGVAGLKWWIILSVWQPGLKWWIIFSVWQQRLQFPNTCLGCHHCLRTITYFIYHVYCNSYLHTTPTCIKGGAHIMSINQVCVFRLCEVSNINIFFASICNCLSISARFCLR
jgi:hypothetical protein